MIIKGRVHKFGDNINTDEIIPARYLNLGSQKELAKHCMETLSKDFYKKVKKGDIIVAGENFGCGSSREHAPLSIKGCGIACVIAKSFARIFFRNAINMGLAILELKDTEAIKNRDILKIDLEKAEIKDITRNLTFKAKTFPKFMQELIRAGGLLDWAKRT